jgi:3-isopropylmalate/(R)-2-methylmalate dehydratase small subunit
MAIERIQRVEGTAVPVRGDNIDTDRIIPARFLRSVSFEGLEEHLFEDDREQAPDHPVSNPRYANASVMIVNANFGCGSSREHAPQAIRRRGIRAIIGESYSEIFFGNSVALGMPCVTAHPKAVAALMETVERNPTTPVLIDLNAMVANVPLRDERTGNIISGCQEFDVRLPAAARDSFLQGTWDATALLLDRFQEVESVATRLPYLNGWH